MFTCCKRRRLSIVKRWSDLAGFHVILKCRFCDWWERRDIPLRVDEKDTQVKSRKRVIVGDDEVTKPNPLVPQALIKRTVDELTRQINVDSGNSQASGQRIFETDSDNGKST